MRIAEVMIRDIAVVQAGDSIKRAAQLMDNLSIGALPVCKGNKLVGMITDRDITGRAGPDGRDPDKIRVADAMSEAVRWCFDTDDVQDVVRTLGEGESHRVPVLDRKKRLVGIVSLGELAEEDINQAQHTPRLQGPLMRN